MKARKGRKKVGKYARNEEKDNRKVRWNSRKGKKQEKGGKPEKEETERRG